MTTWLEAYRKYEVVKEQHAKDAHLMTPLEKQRASEELRGIRRSLGPKIEAAAVQDLHDRFEAHATSQTRLRAAMAGAQKMYDPARLQAELDLASREAGRATSVKDLQRMLSEAEEPHRLKAVAEILAGLQPHLGDQDAYARNQLATRAKAKLEELKYPASVLDALEEGGQAMKGVVDTAHQLTPIAIELDLPRLAREIQRVHTNREDNRPVTEILPPTKYAMPPETDASKRVRLLGAAPETA